MDAVIRLLGAIRWRLRARERSALPGNLACGDMLIPASAELREYLERAARGKAVSIDGRPPA